MNRTTLICGDMREKLAELADESVDAIITDPPYHLTTGKKGGSGLASVNLESPYGRAKIGTGFMGMKWDGGDIAMLPETWALLLRVAKPGAHLLAFGGTRTFHRLWCAVEDAGWEIRDTLMWLHGEGFPKSSNQHGDWKGWGTALKPAFEPILMARKPLIGTVAENLQTHRVGALNIDACRVGYAGTEDAAAAAAAAAAAELRSKQTQRNTDGWGMAAQNKTASDFANGPAGPGRWPANVLHDDSEEVVMAFPQAPGQMGAVGPHNGEKTSINVFGDYGPRKQCDPRGDGGSAARFFWCPKTSRRDRNEGLEGLEALEVSDGRKTPIDNPYLRGKIKRENTHPTVKPTELMQYLIRLVTPKGGIVLDPFMGSGSTGKAALREGMSFIGIELDQQYIEIATARIRAADPLFADVQILKPKEVRSHEEVQGQETQAESSAGSGVLSAVISI